MPPQAPPSQYSRRERVLYVGCEGEATEYDYLRYLNKEYGSGDSETGRPAFTIKPVRKADGLIPSRAVEAVVDAAQGEDETWVLFDRDSHHDIPEAFEAAAASDTEVCFSHPSSPTPPSNCGCCCTSSRSAAPRARRRTRTSWRSCARPTLRTSGSTSPTRVWAMPVPRR